MMQFYSSIIKYKPMKKLTLTTFLLTALVLPAFSLTKICSVTPQVTTNPAGFRFGDQVKIDFSYETDEPGGVRIFIRPFSGGSLTPGYGASGSPLYTGSGSDVASFTINGSVPAVVDELRVSVVNADQSVQIQEFFIPVEFRFGANAVKNIVFQSGSSSGSYLHGHSFSLNFNYDISEPGGARIFFRPFTNGSLTPGYGASGSPAYTGTGPASASFTINSGLNVTVDAIRVQVYNAGQAVLLDEFFIPVYLKFSNVEITGISEPGSIYFPHETNVDFNFDYETTQSGGVRIFFRPFSDGALTPAYAAAGSPVYPAGTGGGSTDFTVTAGNTIVDQTRIQVYNSDQSQLLLEYFLPADYVTGDFDFYNFTACPASPARMENGTRIDMSFLYENMTGADTRLFIRPFTGGALSPNYAASGSPLYGTTAGQGTAFFTITSGDVVVDALRVQVTDAAQTTTLMEFFLPVHYVFGQGVSAAEHLPDPVSAFSLAPNPSGDNATLLFRLKNAADVNVSVHDLMGRPVRTLASMHAGAEQDQTLSLDAASLPDGVYVVRLSGAGVEASRKWVVSR